jgi:conjugal transfer/entry exclusion protein
MRRVLAGSIRLLAAVQLIAVFIAVAQPAYAYVDPGSGLLAFQIITSTFAGMIFILRKRLQSILRTMTLRSGSKRERDPR